MNNNNIITKIITKIITCLLYLAFALVGVLIFFAGFLSYLEGDMSKGLFKILK